MTVIVRVGWREPEAAVGALAVVRRLRSGATKFLDARKGTIVMDVTDAEGEQLRAKGRKQARRGRKPKAA